MIIDHWTWIIGYWMWNAPGTPQRIPTSFSAAPCGGLTRFTSGKPADLGRLKGNHDALPTVNLSRGGLRRDGHREVLPHAIGDDGEARCSRLIGLQRHGPQGAVLRDVHDPEDPRVGNGGAQAKQRRRIREAVLRGDAEHDFA